MTTPRYHKESRGAHSTLLGLPPDTATPATGRRNFYTLLNEEGLADLARYRQLRRYKTGPLTTSSLMILVNGRAAEWVRDAAAEHDGVSVTLYGPGDIIGLTEAILDTDDSSTLTMASVLSVTADVAMIRRGDFAIFADSMGGMFAIRRELARRHREALNEKARMRLPTNTRLCLFLLDLAERFGRRSPHGVELDIPLSQSLIADAVSASRTSVEKALSELRHRGLVHTSYRTLILAPDFAAQTKPSRGVRASTEGRVDEAQT